MMTRSMFVSVIVALMAAASGCKRSPAYLYPSLENSDGQRVSQSFRIQEVVVSENVDIIWVIDNSGSMKPYQTKVHNNAGIFIQELSKRTNINWRMGLLSTDYTDEPYIGFTVDTRLDNLTPGATRLFQAAVSKLGIAGAAEERVFEPLANALTKYTTFLREDAMLVVISVTDVDDQSRGFDPENTLALLNSLKGGSGKIFSYAILGADEFGCLPTDNESQPYYFHGSRHERFLKLTGGTVYPLCAGDYGGMLAQIANNIVKRLVFPQIRLNARPVVASLQVKYRGQYLPSGKPEDLGIWNYDFSQNAIVFHDFGFAQGADEEVEVSFIPDSGR